MKDKKEKMASLEAEEAVADIRLRTVRLASEISKTLCNIEQEKHNLLELRNELGKKLEELENIKFTWQVSE